ncbi:MAG: hypothetical protein EOP86_02000 [Verrucomicrobiaceae bacterium]|nr:MAG: hypothetical protein EOP86_02000 [Verrucomicrobiaceae bacterium]
MKKIGAILSLVGLLSQSSAFAWIGGPYSNNTYDGNPGGVFSGTIRGRNTTGLFKFAQDAQPYVSTFGDSVVYHKGMTYYGESYGQIDFNTSLVSGITNGSNNGANANDPNQSPYYRGVSGSGFGVLNGTGTGNVTTNGTAPAFGSDSVANANSHWNGRVENKKFAMRFTAKGEMSFFGYASEMTIKIDTVSSGDLENPRVNEDTGLNSNPTANNARFQFTGTGSVTQTVSATNNYPDIQDTVNIKVYGSRSSTGITYPAGYAG